MLTISKVTIVCMLPTCYMQLVSLTLDGLTGTVQDRLRATHSASAHHMMYAVNTFSAIYLSVCVIATGELWRVIAFIQQHPNVLLDIAAFSLASAVGQVTDNSNIKLAM